VRRRAQSGYGMVLLLPKGPKLPPTSKLPLLANGQLLPLVSLGGEHSNFSL